ncbi:MAG: PQQ-binding-like beta-propeller repeat protein [Sandaracinaceae bacterium]|nr:PQQ-binding-like beta-propeller repeat protein [Sandaracinaceae bacterium]
MRLSLFGACVALLALALSGAGCGGSSGGNAFAPVYPDNDPTAVDEVVRRLAAATPSDDPVLVGLTESELYAWDLRAGRELWRQPVTEPRGEPLLAGRLVVLHEGSRVVARRVADGRRAFDTPDDHYSLVGAGGEGAVGAFVLSTTGGVGARSVIVITSGEAIANRYEVEVPVGAPAVAAGMVFVPWGSQNVTVIDASTGAEMARFRTLSGVVSNARVDAGQLFFGQAGVGHLAAGIGADSPEQVGWVQPAVAPLPGAPPLFRSAYDPPASARSATHRIELVWTPVTSEGAVAFSDDTIYLTFYELVFGLDPADLSVRWAAQLDADSVGASARAGGVVIADAAGGLTYLAASNGRVMWTAATGAEPTVVTLRLGAFEPSGQPGDEPGFLAEQLLAAAQNTDSRLVPGRAFAIHALAAQEDPAVTGHVIVLCDDRTLPAPLRQAACEALSTRTSGADSVLRALERHASFLEGTTAPPVGALATAAARMSERRAVPLLVSQLRDPDTALEDVPALAAALAALGDRSAVDPLRDYLWLYHADGSEQDLTSALGGVALALARLDGPPGREAVREVLQAAFTSSEARSALAEALEASTPAEPEAAEPSDDE